MIKEKPPSRELTVPVLEIINRVEGLGLPVFHATAIVQKDSKKVFAVKGICSNLNVLKPG
ncbi:hypothetical protein [Acidovorax sp. A1169]|uniref:hypothetical protein n=1 Tax=Acidovorax sp. A1169 TaxID=3059524 RepID=UPI002737D7F1|nr:hypothetical protein [Acidovorax sp. A1169]MDP4075380.1 hypothetical protein [Acidovorax sp. A1169]